MKSLSIYITQEGEWPASQLAEERQKTSRHSTWSTVCWIRFWSIYIWTFTRIARTMLNSTYRKEKYMLYQQHFWSRTSTTNEVLSVLYCIIFLSENKDYKIETQAFTWENSLQLIHYLYFLNHSRVQNLLLVSPKLKQRNATRRILWIHQFQVPKSMGQEKG